MKKLFICTAVALSLGACTTNETMETKLMANLDTTQDPGTDFFRYATGGWQDANPLTDEYARYGQFDALREKSKEQLKELVLEQAAKQSEPGSNAQKVGDLYNMVMDSTTRNAQGTAPVKPLMDEVAAIKAKSEIIPLVAKNNRVGIGGFFGTGIGTDIMDSNSNQLGLYQGGLSLPEKEYYSDNDEITLNIRAKFQEYVVNMFKLHGFTADEAQKKMEAVLGIETRIAAKHLSRVERRDPLKSYHKMTYAELKNTIPSINWDEYYSILGINGIEVLNLAHPEAIKEVAAIINECPLDDLKAYLEWRIIRSTSNELTDEIEAETFAFYGTVLSGKKVQQPRWKRALTAVDGELGDIIGELYVAKHFPPAAKERMTELVKNLQIALGQRIDAQEWMSEETKKAAHEKLNTFTVKIGYPDKWDDYSALTIDPALSYAENCRNMAEFGWKKHIDEKWGKPVDREEWHMTPQTVNAYYNPTTNEICFPAGILQYPFFDMEEDDAFNYGAIGVVIGHEMTHGFDDQGRQFDKDGNFANWWTEEDAAKFNERTQVIVDFFDKIEVLPGLNANGKLTLGENIADHGGLTIAMQAFKNATKENALPVINGLTAEQRFYIAYSGVWAGHVRDEEIRNLTKSDVHSLSRWRVNATLPHINDWYTAFGITEESPMFVPAEERLDVW
ncbi:MAG: M13 family metallopeptidase [Bacteroidaceae bacterium]|nr:M13 family metallopeptidase [Bacteroidaceae bacterium]